MTRLQFFLFVVLIAAFSGEARGQQYGWKWLSPLPQGNSLTSVWPLSETTIVATGHEGTFVRTTDAGMTWEVRHRLKGIETSLSSLHFVDTMYGWCVAAGSLLATTDGGITWTRTEINPGGILSLVFFTDRFHGWVAGYNTLMKTTDGGISWVTLSTGLLSSSISSIYFVNERVGWLGSYALYRTTDGGQSWSPNGPWGPWTWYQSIFFLDSLVGWAGGQGLQFGSLLITTTNGGTTWTTLPTLPDDWNSINSIYFNDSVHGWVLNGSTYVNLTTDGGNTWDTSAHFSPAALISIKSARNSANLWTVGTDGVIATSSNNGSSWTLKSSHSTPVLSATDFLNSDIGWAAGRGGVFKTTNGGHSWVTLLPRSEMQLTSIFALNSLHVWCSSTSPPAVLRTTNGGTDWTIRPVPTPTGQGWYRVFFINERVGWLAGRFGEFRRTTDGGDHWETIPSGTQYDLGGLFFHDSSLGWMVGNSATVLKSTDGGLNWSASRITQVIPHMLWDVQFISPAVGWVAGESSLLKTTNGGSSWTVLRPVDGATIYWRIRFVDALRGWTATNKGIMATSDGGTRWEIQPSPISALGSIDFVDAQRGWAISGSRILATTTGGNITSARRQELIPENATLFQNYPNPFNPTTTISYQLSAVSHVTLKVFDLLGREVATLVDEEMTPGRYDRVFNAEGLASGVYFYQLKAGGYHATRKMFLIR